AAVVVRRLPCCCRDCREIHLPEDSQQPAETIRLYRWDPCRPLCRADRKRPPPTRNRRCSVKRSRQSVTDRSNLATGVPGWMSRTNRIPARPDCQHYQATTTHRRTCRLEHVRSVGLRQI